MGTIAYTESLTTCTCWCGIHLAIPDNLYRTAHSDSKHGVYCPLGHQFFWTESDADKERKAREKVEKQLEFSRRQVAAERDLRQHTERQLSAQRGATTRARKRAAAGVCPCCHRTVSQMARHMATKHPDFDPVQVAA